MEALFKSSQDAGASGVSASPKFGGLKMTPISDGLTIAEVRDSNLLHPVRWMLERSFSQGYGHLGVPLDGPAEVTALHNCPLRAFLSITMMAEALGSARIRLDHVSEASNIAWHSPEGLAILRRKLVEATRGWLSFVISATAESEDLRFGLQEIRAMSKQSGCNVLAILDSTDAARALNLWEYSDEYVEVRGCDPEPDATCSFCLQWMGMEVLAPFGFVPNLFSMHVQDGKYIFRCSPYVHDSLEYRKTWLLRALGLSVKKITEVLEVNKTTVHRRLLEMPQASAGAALTPQRLLEVALRSGLSRSALEAALGKETTQPTALVGHTGA